MDLSEEIAALGAGFALKEYKNSNFVNVSGNSLTLTTSPVSLGATINLPICYVTDGVTYYQVYIGGDNENHNLSFSPKGNLHFSFDWVNLDNNIFEITKYTNFGSGVDGLDNAPSKINATIVPMEYNMTLGLHEDTHAYQDSLSFVFLLT